jgi:hypothetical protein
MGYHPRIECKKISTFQTTRSRCSELWFVNNYTLEQEILGYAAKYAKRHTVQLYALAIEGSHIQFPALFPKANRAHFMRDFNSAVARAVPRRQPNYPGGRLWARRYSAEYLPGAEDIEEQFFYTVLQPVQDGLVDDITKYPAYNCFEDAISGAVRNYPVVNWKKYNDARRWGKTVPIEDFTEFHELHYERLPGYENLSKASYMKLMREKLRSRTALVLKARKEEGKKVMGAQALKRVKPGTLPLHPKTSTRYDHRPRILSKDRERRAQGKAWYFSIYFEYREKSAKYRAGDLKVEFPEGTYKPPAFTIGYTGTIT